MVHQAFEMHQCPDVFGNRMKNRIAHNVFVSWSREEATLAPTLAP